MDSSIQCIASLSSEEILSYMVQMNQGEFDDGIERGHIALLIEIHMGSNASQFPDVLLHKLKDLEATVDQLLRIERTVEIAGLIFDTSEEMMRLFLVENVVTTIVVLLKGLLNLHPTEVSIEKGRLRSCAACLVFLSLVMPCLNGVPWVVEAFDNGLLTILLKATDEMKHIRGLGGSVRGVNGIIEEIIGKVLPKYMSYYSVITAISTIRGRRVAARARRAQESGPLKDKWVAFFTLVTERCAIQGLFSARIRKVPIQCANVECDVELRRGNMLKCAGCLCAFYCSPSCQRRAWKHGNHKADCSGPPTNRGLFVWGTRDMTFFPDLANAHILKNIVSISAQARRQFPSLPSNEISLSIDFRNSPPTVKVLHVNEAARIAPEITNDVRASTLDGLFICFSIHACSAGGLSPSGESPKIEFVSPVRCTALYDLLEISRQPNPDAEIYRDCLEAAKLVCKRVTDFIDEVHGDFRSFLIDTTRKRWSNSDAKDIVCKDFEDFELFA